ncbi:uncharacterized protein LOC128297913 [Anopheles moucheti]|uniref:uncharacterized protein LOC128297913 n=1 Tax=Anopheles moucheti TaxID=186751 RepID=UPI0022F0F4DF|nr:uncharacterized protein LOC128297913 [Anopheles moucheti]
MTATSTNEPAAFDHIETIVIEGQPTDIVYHRFANKLFLIITQHQKVANVYTVRSHAHNDLSGDDSTAIDGSNRIYTIKHTFGASSDEAEAAIRYLMNFMQQSEEIVITLGLRQIDKPTLDQIGAQLRKIVLK